MKIMIVGSGGREYSMGLVLAKDPEVTELFFAPGNGATSRLGTNVSCKDYDALAEFALEKGIELTVVGPEDALVAGIVDIFKAKGLVIFGASKAAARLEGSKIFMKNFLSRYNIPTARYIETSDAQKDTLSRQKQKYSLPMSEQHLR